MLLTSGIILLGLSFVVGSDDDGLSSSPVEFRCSDDCKAIVVMEGSNVLYSKECPTGNGIYCDPSTRGCTTSVSKCEGPLTDDEKFCGNSFTGKVPNVRDCRSYIDCVNGKAKATSCPRGTVFNSKSSDCEKGVPCRTTRCSINRQKLLYITPLNGDPHFYIICMDGELKSLRKCEEGTQFDTKTGSCNQDCKGEQKSSYPATGDNCHRYIECVKIKNRSEYKRDVKECLAGESFSQEPPNCKKNPECNHNTGKSNIAEDEREEEDENGM